MANPEHIQALKNPKAVHASLRNHNRFDFSGEPISFDFSGSPLITTSFAGCKLAGSKFSGSRIERCSFKDSDWAGCNFNGAVFIDCRLARVKNAHKDIGLQNIRTEGPAPMVEFEGIARPWWNRWLDWEKIGGLGKLPLLTASGVALVLIPAYFYLFDLYNQHFHAWQETIHGHEADPFWGLAGRFIDKLGPLKPPQLSLWILISSVCLFIASVLYGWLCPDRVKQFTREQWVTQFQQPLLTYWPHTWTRPAARILCAFLYAVGGTLALIIISIKLAETAVYIWRLI